MKTIRVFFLLVVILGFLFGCVNSFEEFFEYNLFAGLDPVITPSVTELESMDDAAAMDILIEEFASDAFIESLQENPTEQAELEVYLSGFFADRLPPVENPAELEVYQVAAILYAEVNMAGGGNTFANNLIGLVSVLTESGSGGSEPMTDAEVKEVFQVLLPENVDTKAAFMELVAGMRDASHGYLAFGSSLDINGDGEVADEERPADINLGEVTQNAAIAVVIDKFVTVLETNGSEDPVGGIYDWLVNGAEPNFMTEDIEQSFTNLTEDPAMKSLLDSTGLLNIFFPEEEPPVEGGETL